MEQKAREVVAGCRNLPTIPAIALQVLKLSREENVDLRQIAEVISRDVALSGKILRVVNSAFYGLQRQVGTISQAVVMLGLASVKTLALGFSLASGINEKGMATGDLQAFWRRSLFMAVAARLFAERKLPIVREEAFIAGLLADVGSMAMGEKFGERYAKFSIVAEQDHHGVVAQEQVEFSTDHVEVGCCMIDSWHLPQLLVVPVACHHDLANTTETDPTVLELARIVFIANLCAEAFCGGRSRETLDKFEAAVREQLGFDQQACRDIVKNLHSDAEEVAAVLQIKIPESTSYSDIVMEANEELTRLSLASQQKANTVERDKEAAETKVKQLEKSNRELFQSANHDPLTGVYNRRFMEGFMEREIARAGRFRRPLSVLFIDIDHFKSVNDKYGHPVGDAVLKQVAQLLRAGTREVDCLCRYGGEEFVMMLLETDLCGATQLAEKVRRLIEGWRFKADGLETELHVTVSIGCASMNVNRPVDKAVLIQMADQSVYAAKQEGRNCVCAMRKRVMSAAAKV